jgi:hypothetical protein
MAENMQIYFDISKGVLFKAGVAVLNPDFDPEVSCSQEILITHPERTKLLLRRNQDGIRLHKGRKR